MIYADAGHYLKHKTEPIIGFRFEGNIEDFDEIPLNNPIDIEIIDSKIVLYNNRKLALIPSSFNYDSIKKALIKLKYDNDSQIAIILNKDSGEESALLDYQKMQEWREWASELGHLIINKYEKSNE